MTELDENVRYLIDRMQILDCVVRYCVGVDRHQDAQITSAFHDYATDDHGPFIGTAAGFASWVNDMHSENYVAHTHNITTHSCDIDGDRAFAQSYCIYGLRRADPPELMLGCARYLDDFEKRGGVWRISRRRVLIEWRGRMQADMPDGYASGTWDLSDPSYDNKFVAQKRVHAGERIE